MIGRNCSDGGWFTVGNGESGGPGAGHDGPTGDGEIEQRLVERFPSHGSTPMADVLKRRTRWIDDVTLRCIDEDIRQVVLVASGYDCRALRFRTPGVRFIELDHPATHADKQRILDEMGVDVTDISYAAADFIVDDGGAALAAAGHDASTATLFLVEGLLIYLPEDVIVSLLTALRARATPASRMAVSISRGQSPEFCARVAAVGEHTQSCFSEDEAGALLQRCGWHGDTTRSFVLASPTRTRTCFSAPSSDPAVPASDWQQGFPGWSPWDVRRSARQSEP